MVAALVPGFARKGWGGLVVEATAGLVGFLREVVHNTQQRQRDFRAHEHEWLADLPGSLQRQRRSTTEMRPRSLSRTAFASLSSFNAATPRPGRPEAEWT